MAKLFKDMTQEEKDKVYARTERYRKKNMGLYAKSSLNYYHNNKEKCALKAKLWRENNRDYIRTKQRLDKRKRKEEAVFYLGGTCAECGGEFHPSIFEFHHKEPQNKHKDPSKCLSLSKSKLRVELDKCILLCANCHRLVHHKENYDN